MTAPNLSAQPLRALDFPLHGTRLIEASAGTGKTWTIAALYLRLVLGHGQPDCAWPGGPLQPPQILVMTFTRAATRELSDRIRQRLLEATACFRQQQSPATQDTLLQDLLAAYPDPQARTEAAWRLALAAENMDDAAIYTIDGWCQRMLREHAFDSGSLFSEAVASDLSELQQQAVHDYWRQHIYPLPSAQLQQVLPLWPSVGALEQQLQALWDQPLPPVHSAVALPALLAQVQHELQQVQALWSQHLEQMEDWLRAPEKHVKTNSRTLDAMFRTLRAWLAQPSLSLPALTDAALKRLDLAGLQQEVQAKGLALPVAFVAFDQGWQQLRRCPSLAERLLPHAAAWVRQRLAMLKRQAGSLSFADLQERLLQALQGPQGPALRLRLRQQYPVALIDEFQDTSPLQYQIFSGLYVDAAEGAGGAASDCAMFLIGDPKQSIYAFRGADIHSYLRARQATQGRHYQLDTNYRSSRALVAALNALWSLTEGHADRVHESATPAAAMAVAKDAAPIEPQRAALAHPQGAFLFRRGNDHALPYWPVRAQGRSEQLVQNQRALPALHLAYASTSLLRSTYIQDMAEHCAEQMLSWLQDPSVGFIDLSAAPGSTLRRVQAQDMAVLVRTGREAEAMRQALQRRGLACVYLSARDSVFATAEAQDLLRWLQAAAQPLHGPWARAALATASAGLSGLELERLASDDLAWDARIEQIKGWQHIWQRQGVLAMVRHILHQLELPARWLSQPGGERALTNMLHLGELLQQASQKLESDTALLRWLSERVQDPERAAGDETILRLESDADLIKVVTIHKAKGLEYPLVFLPFPCAFRDANQRAQPPMRYVDEHGQHQLSWNPEAEISARIEQARLQEDVRLLYVALTRAQHALWLGVAQTQERNNSKTGLLHRSALGHVLGVRPEFAASDWPAYAHQLQAWIPDLHVQALPARAARNTWRSPQAQSELPAAWAYAGGFDQSWSLASFSALTRDLQRQSASAAGLLNLSSARAAVWLELGAIEPNSSEPNSSKPQASESNTNPSNSSALAASPAQQPTGATEPQADEARAAAAHGHHFPRGPAAGNFLHEQLQWLAEEQFQPALSPEDSRWRARIERAGWGHRQDEVCAWLRALVQTPLPPLQQSLSGLGPMLAEMEFWCPNPSLHSPALDACCQTHVWPQHTRPPLPERELHGMLKGYADLVFEHQGRYWVLDYKSNVLGVSDLDYHPEALTQAVLAHRYDVQAALYLLALHRLLQQRLGSSYQAEQHLGGALIWFIRGWAAPSRGCVHLPVTTEFLTALDQLFTAHLGARNECAC